MSKLLPSATILAFRQAHNVILDVYGISVTLFLVTNLDSVENLDVYKTEADHVYTQIETTAHFVWKKDMYRLRKLGLYTEGELPIEVHLPNFLGNVPIGSYLKVSIKYLPNDVSDTDEFEIINQSLPNLNDQEPFLIYACTPKRKIQ